MIYKQQIIALATEKFTQFGSKQFTMDELAAILGVSKKTIYKHFSSKEDLVSESVRFLIEKIKKDIDETLKTKTNPILKIVAIYQIGFEYFKCFGPSFVFGLKKYYPKASTIFETFRRDIVFKKVHGFLEEAKEKQILKQDINIALVCELYFLRIDSIIYKSNNFFEVYSNEELLNHLVIYNLRGIINTNCLPNYFE